MTIKDTTLVGSANDDAWGQIHGGSSVEVELEQVGAFHLASCSSFSS
jgi:hypothetical protein